MYHDAYVDSSKAGIYLYLERMTNSSSGFTNLYKIEDCAPIRYYSTHCAAHVRPQWSNEIERYEDRG
jgi:hypothetical protein